MGSEPDFQLEFLYGGRAAVAVPCSACVHQAIDREPNKRKLNSSEFLRVSQTTKPQNHFKHTNIEIPNS